MTGTTNANKIKSMEFRELNKLTDNEIKFILKDILNVSAVYNIQKRNGEILATIEKKEEIDNKEFVIKDNIRMTYEHIFTNKIFYSPENDFKYMQFLIKKGSNLLLKDNKYF